MRESMDLMSKLEEIRMAHANKASSVQFSGELSNI
jgi:hypothetical protein